MAKKILVVFIAFFIFSAKSIAAWNPDDVPADGSGGYPQDIADAIAAFRNNDPSMDKFFDNAYGFAVFPSIGKGGIGIGGAAGRGKVYEQGVNIGNVKLTQFTIGFQFGGQKYREIIFFKDKSALDRFTSGKFKFGAQASAIAATAGASADAAYSDNVAVFTLPIKGLMYEATIGGQKFKFRPN